MTVLMGNLCREWQLAASNSSKVLVIQPWWLSHLREAGLEDPTSPPEHELKVLRWIYGAVVGSPVQPDVDNHVHDLFWAC